MKKERNNTIITEYCYEMCIRDRYCYEKTNYNQYQSCSEEKHFLCGRIFVATDIEYDATIYSFPQPRKRCGGIRTLPVLHSIFTSVYKKKRKNMEKMIRYTLLRYS
ncbi:hypothetical protein ABH000_20530 [Bacteroides ovatus]